MVLIVAEGTEVLVGRVPVASRVDLGTVDGLGRLQLGARRRGWRVALRHPGGCPLSDLLDLVGLSATLDEALAEAGRRGVPQSAGPAG